MKITPRARCTSGLPDRRLGVTLIEMLMVVVVIGILSGMAASRLDWVRYRADSISRGVMAELSQAHRLSVSLQINVRVTAVGGTRLTIHEDANNDGTINNGERVMTHVLDHGFRLLQGTAPAVPVPDDPTELTALVFHRDGSASRGGTFYIASPATDPTCRYCRAVSVSRGTGRVVWYTLATGTWRRGN
ncbi:MAG: type II secretion system protein [Gemmatimonadales bacterium]|nr:type II secretion system protein [Gemmatimonadales bacterium]MDZ4389400.1 type II secretion system protein [Gemmatimonadales bacterium]